MPEFIHRQELPVSAEAAYAWCARPGALARLLPPFLPAELLQATPGLQEGATATLRLGVGPLRLHMQAVHEHPSAPEAFYDVQRKGPFRRWRHAHRFLSQEQDSCIMEDRLDWEAPLGRLGRVLSGRMIEKTLRRVFTWRGLRMHGDLQRHAQEGAATGLRIAVSGASGLLGRELCTMLRAGGQQVLPLVRRAPAGEGELLWSVSDGPAPGALQGVDAVVHLAGENIAAGRWTAARKQELYHSRVMGTRRISEAVAQARRAGEGPRTLICASAIGFYGDGGESILDERSPAGQGFMSELVADWEAACAPAAEAGVRVVQLRLGVVLSPRGGALGRMLPPFQLGLGGPLGSGKQWFSWVCLEDVLGAVVFALHTPSLQGALNLTAPYPLRMAEFAHTLGRLLRRPARLRVPALALRLAFGELAVPLLASQRILPAALSEAGFAFRHPRAEDSLRFQLGRFA